MIFSLTINDGEIVALVGRSGCDKSTVGNEIGRAHVWTPVTCVSRMPSSAWKKKK